MKSNVFEINLMLLNSISKRKSYSKLFPEAPGIAEVTDNKMHEIKARIAEILKDERLYYPSATVFENAPLALVQYGMEVELHALEKVLDLPLTNISKLRSGKRQPN